MNLTRDEILDLPAALPPPGVIPNFENPPNMRSFGLPLFVLLAVVTNSVFLAKLWVQIRIAKKMLLEDWMLNVAWLIYVTIFTAFGCMIIDLPMGMHQWDMNLRKLERHLFLFNCVWIIYGFLMILLKTNILLQYIRIFVPDGTRSFISVASYGLIALNVIFYLLFSFILIFLCIPRHKIWDPTVKHGHCLDFRLVLLMGNIVTFVSDLLIWVLPQRIIWRLHMVKSRKWGLSALFAIGIFAVICSGVRIDFTINLFRESRDITYVANQVCVWGTLQVSAGFLVACLPVFPLLHSNIKKQPWTSKLGSSIKTLFKQSRSGTQGMSTKDKTKAMTIGGGGGGVGGRGKVPTDVEFDELVNATEVSIVTNASRMSGDDLERFSEVSERHM